MLRLFLWDDGVAHNFKRPTGKKESKKEVILFDAAGTELAMVMWDKPA